MSLRILVALLVAAFPFGAAMAGGVEAGERPVALPQDPAGGTAEAGRSGGSKERPSRPIIRVAKGYAVGGRSPYRRLPIEGTADPLSKYVKVELDDGRTYYAHVHRDGSWDLKIDLRPGKRTATAVAVDLKGNEGPPSKRLKVKIIKLRSTVDLNRLDGEDGAALWVRGFDGDCYRDSELVAATDLDADGLDDVLLGGAWANGSGKLLGKMGSKRDWDATIDLPTLPAGEGLEIVGGVHNELQYAGVASAGDLNGDGYGDFAVIASDLHGASDDFGLLAVLYGGKGGFPRKVDLNALTPDQGFRLLGNRPYRGPARPVQGVGDVNGDGIDDLAFRAFSTVHVLFGKRGFERRDTKLSDLGDKDGVQLHLTNVSTGVSIAGGDVDNDGISDLVVGVVETRVPGSINIIFGRKNFPSEAKLVDLARTTGMQFRAVAGSSEWFSVASGFDLNGDRHDDIAMVSSEGYFDRARKGFVLYGASRARLKAIDPAKRIGEDAGFRLAGGQEGAWWLQSAAGGDVNDDGLDDLVLGATNGGEAVGFVVYGSRERPDDALDLSALYGLHGYRLVFSGPTSVARIACTVAGTGDVNGDGIDDIVVSGRSGSRIEQPGAAAYVVFGRPK